MFPNRGKINQREGVLLLVMHASKLTCHVDLSFQGDVVHSVFMHGVYYICKLVLRQKHKHICKGIAKWFPFAST